MFSSKLHTARGTLLITCSSLKKTLHGASKQVSQGNTHSRIGARDQLHEHRIQGKQVLRGLAQQHTTASATRCVHYSRSRATYQLRWKIQEALQDSDQDNFLPLHWDCLDMLTHVHSFENGMTRDCTYFVSLDRRCTVMEQLMSLLQTARHCAGTVKVILQCVPSHSCNAGWDCTTLNDTVLELFGASLQKYSEVRFAIISGDTSSSAKRQLAKWSLPIRYVRLETTPAFLAHCPEDAVVVYHERRVRLAFSSHDAFMHRPSYQLGGGCFNLSSSRLRSFVLLYNAVASVNLMLNAAELLRQRFGSDVDISVAAIPVW